MHIHLPKPLHGWREVAGEIAVIVVGVLIALAAEQLVESVHWRNEVTEFREAADHELAYDVAAYQYRARQEPCISRRIAELKRWGEAHRRGEARPLGGEIGRPSVLIFRSGVWGARSAEVMTHMPLDARVGYASLYDRLANLQGQIVDEREAWRSLAAFNGARRLSEENLMRLNELVFRAESIDRVMRTSVRQITNDIGVLGITPRLDNSHVPAPDPSFCKSLLS